MKRELLVLITSATIALSSLSAFALEVSEATISADFMELLLVPVEASSDVTVDTINSLDTVPSTLVTTTAYRDYTGYTHGILDHRVAGVPWQSPPLYAQSKRRLE